MTPEQKKALADRINKGLRSDIFYDAYKHNDEEAGDVIEDFEMACREAVNFLRQ